MIETEIWSLDTVRVPFDSIWFDLMNNNQCGIDLLTNAIFMHPFYNNCIRNKMDSRNFCGNYKQWLLNLSVWKSIMNYYAKNVYYPAIVMETKAIPFTNKFTTEKFSELLLFSVLFLSCSIFCVRVRNLVDSILCWFIYMHTIW